MEVVRSVWQNDLVAQPLTFDNVWDAANHFQWHLDHRGNGGKAVGIEDNIERKFREVYNRLDDLCPRGLYTSLHAPRGKKINPSVNDVLLVLLDHLGLEPVLSPDEYLELREKKED